MFLQMLGLALGVCLAAPPGPPKKEGVELISTEALKGYSVQIAAKESTNASGKRVRSGSQLIGDRGNFTYTLVRRDESGEPEIHADWTDLFVVQEGGGSVLTGGKVKGAREASKGEQRGGEIIGGTQQKIAVGDVLIIPATVPHQVLVPPGSFITYLVVKVRKVTDR